MFGAEEIIRRLKPLLGQQADTIWNSFLASDEEERKLIQHSLEIMHSQAVDDYKQEKIILTPPSKFEQLYGDYPVGMVWYADKPLYPFALLERELVQHIGIFGRTGAGKSYLVRGLLLTHLLYNKPVLLFDWKGTYTDFTSHPAGVLLFIPGSASLPFCFNPLDLEGIPSEQHKAYLRQVIDIFIDSYLEDLKLLTVQGVEYLLLLAVDNLMAKKGSLTFSDIYEWLTRFEGRMREMDWKTSALTILYKLITGPLGNVMQKSWNMEWLVKQKALFELNNAGSAKDKSFLIRTLLLRLYYHFQEKGTSDALKLLIIIEEAHNILLRKDSGYETIIELVLRQIREFGVGICVVDQHPSLMSLPALGTYCTVSFNLRLKQDRDAMASALLLDRDERAYLGKLPPRFAVVKIQDRFLTPFLIQTFYVSRGNKPSVSEIKNRMAKLLPALPDSQAEEGQVVPEKGKEAQVIAQLAAIKISSGKCSQLYSLARIGSRGSDGRNGVLRPLLVAHRAPMAPMPLEYKGKKRAETGTGKGNSEADDTDGNEVPMAPMKVSESIEIHARVIDESELSRIPGEVLRHVRKKRGKPLTWEELFLCHIYTFPLMATLERYRHFGLNDYQGNKHRHSLLKSKLIAVQQVSTSTGRIRLLMPTEKGFQWLKEQDFYS